jgi:serine protease Do
VDKVREIMIGLLTVRRAGHAWLGLALRTDTGSRAVVKSVERGSPALAAGLAADDVIETLDGRAVADCLEFETAILDRKAGDPVRLGVRRGGTAAEHKVVLAEAPKPDGASLARRQFGLHLQQLKEELAKAMRLAVDRGLLVAAVDEGSPAAGAGIRPGDIVVQVDRYRVDDLDTLGQLLDQVNGGDRILFYVVRGRAVARVVLASRGRDEAP